MPISVSCPDCQATYRVPDEAAGKAVKCKKCGARITVPAADAPPGGGDEFDFNKPAKGGAKAGKGAAGAAGAADEGEGDAGGAPKKKSNTGKILAIVGGILALSCCVCGGGAGFGAWWIYGKAKDAVKDAIVIKDGKDKIIIKDFGKDMFKDAFKDAFKDMPKKGGGPPATGATVFQKTDNLSPKDAAGALGKPAKVYKVKLEAGKEYVIDMKAEKQGFGQDPYLILLDPQGKQVAKDDDSGGGPGGFDAQIRYTPPAAGEYTIQATCFAGVLPEGLPFNLTVKAAK